MNDIDLNALAAPIAKQYVKSREVGGGRKAAYITARTAMNRLDEVCGRENWRTEYRLIQSGKETGIECTLYIRINGEWVGKADVGDPSNIDPLKGAYSDALKRAAAQWGVARELYGDGNAYETDDEPPAKTALTEHFGAKSTPPAPVPTVQPAATTAAWHADTMRIVRLLDYALDQWRSEADMNRTHALNRLARALDVTPDKGSDFNALAQAVKAQYQGSEDEARAAVENYHPSAQLDAA